MSLGGGGLLFSGGKWRWGESERAEVGGNLKRVEEETVVIMYKKRMYVQIKSKLLAKKNV